MVRRAGVAWLPPLCRGRGPGPRVAPHHNTDWGFGPRPQAIHSTAVPRHLPGPARESGPGKYDKGGRGETGGLGPKSLGTKNGPTRFAPFVNSGLSHDGHFGLEERGGGVGGPTSSSCGARPF